MEENKDKNIEKKEEKGKKKPFIKKGKGEPRPQG